MKQNNKSRILYRYGIISIMFLLFSVAIIVKLAETTIIEAGEWNKQAKKELSAEGIIAPERGNILASNGNILACNLKVYDIKVDLRHNKVLKMRSIDWQTIDSLADSLDTYYPRRPEYAGIPDSVKKYSWHTKLRKELEKDPGKRNRALTIARKRSQEDFNRIRNFPFFKDFKGKGYRIPIYKTERNIRMYPYGKMAYRSIGRVNEHETTGEIHGYSGLEKDLDSLLYGIPGKTKKVALTSGIGNWTAQAPVRGYDIVTTIDIDIQDMLEEELLAVCDSFNAEWGTAILMEVATGEIKAISNIERLSDGSYGEALNRAVTAFEPGSVMKPISLMIAFEDGLVNGVNDMVSCAPFQKTSDPHGGGMKTMKQVIEQSSNPGIARVIFRGYGKDPSKFHDRLASIGFFEPMRSGIADEETPRVRKLLPTDGKGHRVTMTARHLDLARQAYGYNTVIPPLYTLAYYNAIANKGKLVRPHLVRALRSENGRDSILPTDYIRDQVCSPETAEKVKQCIREVVWGEHGTARLVRDDRVMIAGKTGTAYPVEKHGYNKAKRRYAFAGFYPYDSPKYSCMALVLAGAGTSANRTSGQIVKNMALKMYARGMLGNKSNYASEKRDTEPVFSQSTTSDDNKIRRSLKISKARKYKTSATKSAGRIPDVRGYDAVSAVRILERCGYNVRLTGAGKVVGQSPAAGSLTRRGIKVELRLKV